MSKDDFDVIVCKILSYLYACLKEGVQPSPSKAKELAGCNDLYWEAALDDLSEKNLVKIERDRVCGEKYACIRYMRITMDGAQFLDENSMMQKVRSALGSILTEAIAAAVGATSLI